jgi:PKD repeat protein
MLQHRTFARSLWIRGTVLILLSAHATGRPAAPQEVGTVAAQVKIADRAAGFDGTLLDNDQFGRGAAAIGDFDQNGVLDLIVGAHGSDDGGLDRGSAWILFMASNGRVLTEQKISSLEGNFIGWLDNKDQFGRAVDGLGDLDQDGVPDVVVSSNFDDDGGPNRGAVYVLFLNASGTVKSVQKISSTAGNFAGPLLDQVEFGRSVCNLGDIDGDGVNDIAAGASYDSEAGLLRGSVWVLRLNRDGTVKGQAKINDVNGGIPLSDADFFGHAVGGVGDLDGDGTPDLLVGSIFDDDGCLPGYDCNRGAIYLCHLNPDGSLKSYAHISDTVGGFGGGLEDFDHFGSAVCSVGDLNCDGTTDVAVGAVLDDDGGTSRGAVWILFLRPDGTCLGQQKISASSGGFFGPLDDDDWLGSCVARIDLAPQGYSADFLAGARFDDDGGVNHGAVYLLDLVRGTPPVIAADFTGAPTTGAVPLTVGFTDASTGASSLTYEWDFGDGATATGANPTHAYATPGSYTVALTIHGPCATEDTQTKVGYVTALPAPPVADFDAAPVEGERPLSVAFGDRSTGIITSHLWTFGDGDTSTASAPAHTYEEAGSFTVSLQISGPGGSDTLTRVDYIQVDDPAPVAGFVGAPISGVWPLSVSFDDLSTGLITSWEWSFGDGQTTTTQDPVHEYTAPGTYDVQLTVLGPGGTDSLVRTDYVEVLDPAPSAQFSADPRSGYAPLGVPFTNLSSGPIDSHAWDFGDGQSATVASPTHVYALPGTYSVVLSETGPGGVDVETKVDWITVVPPPQLVDGGFEQQVPDQAPAAPWSVTFGVDHLVRSSATSVDGTWPREGSQWCDLSAEGTFAAIPPSNPFGTTTPPIGAAGVQQLFAYPAGASLLRLDAAFLRSGPADQAAFNDFMSVDVSDGATTLNLFYADTFTLAPNTSQVHGLPLTDVSSITVDLRARFPTSTPATLFTLSLQVGNGGDGLGASRAYVDHVRLEPGGSLEIYGCGTNPAGSMLVLSGTASLGSTFVLGLDNPLGTQAPNAKTFLFFAYGPDPSFPCGFLVPNFGMSGPGAAGELLLDLALFDSLLAIFGPPWQGLGMPAAFPLSVPNDPTLLGHPLYSQGILIDSSALFGVKFALTDAVEIVTGP